MRTRRIHDAAVGTLLEHCVQHVLKPRTLRHGKRCDQPGRRTKAWGLRRPERREVAVAYLDVERHRLDVGEPCAREQEAERRRRTLLAARGRGGVETEAPKRAD